MAGPASSLYEGETYRLNFRFSQKYPFDSPEVSHAPAGPRCGLPAPRVVCRIRPRGHREFPDALLPRTDTGEIGKWVGSWSV